MTFAYFFVIEYFSTCVSVIRSYNTHIRTDAFVTQFPFMLLRPLFFHSYATRACISARVYVQPRPQHGLLATHALVTMPFALVCVDFLARTTQRSDSLSYTRRSCQGFRISAGYITRSGRFASLRPPWWYRKLQYNTSFRAPAVTHSHITIKRRILQAIDGSSIISPPVARRQ